MAEECVLYDRECIDCGECDMCDLIEGKHCDDCGKCIDSADEYRTIDAIKFLNERNNKK